MKILFLKILIAIILITVIDAIVIKITGQSGSEWVAKALEHLNK